MENKNNKGHKLTYKNIFFLCLFGLLIVIFKYYFTRGNFCHNSCVNINSELDVIRCLDACAINGEDFREPITFNRIFSLLAVIILLSVLLYLFINYFILRRNQRTGRNKILEFIEYLKDLQDRFINKNKYEKFGYKRLDDQ